MRAARIYGVEDMRVEDVAEPDPAPGQALIRIEACGVCPSDLRSYFGSQRAGGRSTLPRTPGHEWAGVVVDIRRGALAADDGLQLASTEPDEDGVHVGDRVVADWRTICGRCYQCRRGALNYCEHLLGGVHGGFCELGVAPLSQLRVLPASVSFEEAAFTEPLACILNAHAQTPIELGDDVVVLGVGPIGLLHVQVAAHRGARVIAVDRLPARLEAARALGAHDTIDASDGDPLAHVRELTEGRGAATVIVAVGGAEPTKLGMDLAAINGWVNFFAGTYPTAEMNVDPNLIHYRQLRITGSHDFTPHHFSAALKLVQFGIVRVAPLISHRFTLPETEQAFRTAAGRAGLKSMVLPTARTIERDRGAVPATREVTPARP